MTLYEIPVTTIRGDDVTLAVYRGRVLLVVNVASECGFTPQYAGLERLHRAYGRHGLVVLGFPCNQFGGQEPGAEPAIEAFCRARYDVTFPMFAKVDVKGVRAHPLFRYLTCRRAGLLGSRVIKWNFTKFLVGRDGTVQRRYAPTTRPERLEQDIVTALA
jgi:glutathione peroxidase